MFPLPVAAMTAMTEWHMTPVAALHKNVQIVVMQKCRVMKKLLSVNTFHSLWVATTQFFFISPKLEQHPPTLNQQMSNNLNWNGQLGSRILQLKCCWWKWMLSRHLLGWNLKCTRLQSGALHTKPSLKCLVVRVRVSKFLVDIYV